MNVSGVREHGQKVVVSRRQQLTEMTSEEQGFHQTYKEKQGLNRNLGKQPALWSPQQKDPWRAAMSAGGREKFCEPGNAFAIECFPLLIPQLLSKLF